MNPSMVEKGVSQFNNFVNMVNMQGRDILLGMVILVIGLFVAKWIYRLLRRGLGKFISKEALISSISSIVFILLMVFVIDAALEQAGMQGIVVRRIIFGMTMIIILLIMILRPYMPSLPFKIGNFVKIGDLLGTVESTTLTHTRLKTVDGKTVFIPNTQILKEAVINFHFTPNRRVEVDVGIGYDQDLLRAKQIIESILIEDPRILENPRPIVYVLGLADSCVELSGRGWVKNSKYWKTKCDLIEKTKLRLDLEGIKIAYPQRDVHLYYETPVPVPGNDGNRESSGEG